MNLFQELLNLLVPSKCQLCGRRGWTLCQPCRNELWVQPRVTTRLASAGGLELVGLSFFDYRPPLPDLMHAFKERGVTELVDHLVESIDGQKLAAAVNQLRGLAAPTELLLVPVPSSKQAYRVRGFSPAVKVAKSLSKSLNSARLQNRVVTMLRRTRAVSDQAGLSTPGRWQNQQGSMAALHKINADVLLIDDIVTTGATLLEASRVVGQAGGRVVGFCTIAETLLKQPVKNAKPDT